MGFPTVVHDLRYSRWKMASSAVERFWKITIHSVTDIHIPEYLNRQLRGLASSLAILIASEAETDQQLCEVVGDPDERRAQGEWAAEFGHGEHGIGRNEAEGSDGCELVAEVGQQGRRGHRGQDECVNDYGHQQRAERVLNRREYKAERCEDGDQAELAKRVMTRPVARQELREHHDVDEVPEEESGKASEKELVGAKDAEARYSEQEVSDGAEGERNAEKIANAEA